MSASALISVCVSPNQNPAIQARVAVRCESRPDGVMAHQVDVQKASGQELRPALAQVLKSEIVAGLLTGRHKAKGGWTLTVESISGSDGDEMALLQIPSIGYAIAATLAVLHGTGVEDLQTDPHGGHGWQLISLETAA